MEARRDKQKERAAVCIETAEILADEKLLKRLKAGSAAARWRKGRFVE